MTNKANTGLKENRTIKLLSSVIPSEKIAYNEWCRQLNVSSAYINKKVCDMNDIPESKLQQWIKKIL